jgi:hypothetical protein
MGAIADVQSSGNTDVGLFEHFDFGNEALGSTTTPGPMITCYRARMPQGMS